MKFGTMYNQGDIVIVPFPFSDLSAIKQRPVLILSRDKDIQDSEDVITCGMTSNLKNAKYSIMVENKDLEIGSIPVKSRIKLDKIFTLDKKTIIKKVAKINKQTLEKVKKEFVNLI
ncbi:MazF family transcriptional regulator [Candidatus Pacearchaeota archaeon CG10_big_fil_rev_8_21_14_0_10_34_76]|nr:MAG: MazF family transcriptional regulator [Candidatus Pacearchaeota archaeon CG10_big_fil_rev_8_21_14_0_10_34_76]